MLLNGHLYARFLRGPALRIAKEYLEEGTDLVVVILETADTMAKIRYVEHCSVKAFAGLSLNIADVSLKRSMQSVPGKNWFIFDTPQYNFVTSYLFTRMLRQFQRLSRKINLAKFPQLTILKSGAKTEEFIFGGKPVQYQIKVDIDKLINWYCFIPLNFINFQINFEHRNQIKGLFEEILVRVVYYKCTIEAKLYYL